MIRFRLWVADACDKAYERRFFRRWAKAGKYADLEFDRVDRLLSRVARVFDPSLHDASAEWDQ